MRYVRTTVAITFDDLSKSYASETLVPGILCRATYEDDRGAKLVPVEFQHLVARVVREAYTPESPLKLLAEQAE